MRCDALQETVMSKLSILQRDLNAESEKMSASYREEAESIDPDVDTTGPNAWVKVDVDIQWKTEELSLHLPEIRLVDKKMSLDVPQVTVKDRRIVFETPSVKMVTRKVGEYPEFKCSGFIPKCTVKWSNIYADVPETFMERHEIVIGIPEFKMQQSGFVIGIPEISMRRANFLLDLPQITIKNIREESAEAREKAESLSTRAKAESEHLKKSFAEEAKMTIGYDVNAMFDCYHEELSHRKNEAVTMFMSGAAAIQAGLDTMVARKVPEEIPALAQARESLKRLLAHQEQFLKTIEQQFSDLDQQRQKFVRDLLGG